MKNFPPNTAPKLARMLVLLGYPESAVRATVRKRFPDEDADAAVDAALRQKDQSDKQLERDLDREALEQEMRD